MTAFVKKELFFDDQEIEAIENLTRTLNKPKMVSSDPILVPEHPWEGDEIYGGTALYDSLQDKFRMWYCGYYKAADAEPVRGWAGPALRGEGYSSTVCYAESEDGYLWKKPWLNRVGSPQMKSKRF